MSIEENLGFIEVSEAPTHKLLIANAYLVNKKIDLII